MVAPYMSLGWMVFGVKRSRSEIPHPHPLHAFRKKDLLWQRGLTQEVNMKLRGSLQSSFPCKHNRAAVTSAASPDALLLLPECRLWGVNESIMIAEFIPKARNCTFRIIFSTIISDSAGCLQKYSTVQWNVKRIVWYSGKLGCLRLPAQGERQHESYQ